MAEVAPAPPLHPAEEVIEISSEEENSSDTSSSVDPDTETEVEGDDEPGSTDEEEPRFRPRGNRRSFNALVPLCLFDPPNLRMTALGFEVHYLGPHDTYVDEGDSDSIEVEEQEEEEPLFPVSVNCANWCKSAKRGRFCRHKERYFKLQFFL